MGKFIVIEGLDLSGKTTLIKELAYILREMGYTVSLHKEPNDEVKEILKQYTNVEVQYKALINYRQEHQRSLKYDIEHYDFVICDRYITSTYVFQGRGIGFDRIDEDNKDFIQPDLEIVLEIPYSEYKKRCGNRLTDRLDRFSQKEYNDLKHRYRFCTKGVIPRECNARDIAMALQFRRWSDEDISKAQRKSVDKDTNNNSN